MRFPPFSPVPIRVVAGRCIAFALLLGVGVGFASSFHVPRRVPPAEVARDQLHYLQSRAGTLTPEQVRLLGRVPYRASSQLAADRARLLRLSGKGGVQVETGRRRVLGRDRVDSIEDVAAKGAAGDRKPLEADSGSVASDSGKDEEEPH